MARGGVRGGSGRPAGSPNKATAEQRKAVLASGLTPLEYMLSVMRDEANENAVRLSAANSAAPYVHPKLSTVTAKVDHDVSERLTEIVRRIVRPDD